MITIRIRADLDRQNQNLTLLIKLEVLLGAFSALTVVLLYTFLPQTLNILPVAQIVVYLGIFISAYYLTIHQLIKKKFLRFSAILLSLLTLGNVLILIWQSGSFDSAFYSLWLLVLAVSGLFSFGYTAALFTLTGGYFLYQALQSGHSSTFAVNKLEIIITTLIALVLARLFHAKTHQVGRTARHAEALSGQLNKETFKTDLLMKSMGDGVIVVDPDLNIRFLNPAAQMLTGWNEEDAHDINWRQVMPLRDAQDKLLGDQDDPFMLAWRHGKSYMSNNLSLLTKGERRIALAVTVSPIYGPSHKIDGGIGVFRDISHEKEIERQRNEFVSTASHEMRSPLATIEGYLSLAMNPQMATIDKVARKYLEKAHESTARMGQLFKDLLSVTKLEDSSFVSHIEIFDIGALVQEVIEDMQFVAKAKKIQLDLRSSIGDLVKQKSILPFYYVSADRERLREVITNLIDNAIKFTNTGEVSVSLNGDHATVTVNIKDTGIGIAREDMPHLFQKFYRIKNPAAATEGTGLGLYLCRSIIELYGGKIWVESVPSKGSTFKFTLPRQKQPEIAREHTKVADINHKL